MSIRRVTLVRRPKPRPPFAPAGSTLVYFEAGQSNSNGLVGQGNDGFSYTFTQSEAFWKSSQVSKELAILSPFSLGVNTNREGATQPDPSIYAVQYLEGLILNQIKVCQVGQGGTGFDAGAGVWASGGGLSIALQKGYVKPLLQTLAAAGDDVYMLPLFWIQGEKDASNSTNADAYDAQFSAFISAFRNWVNVPDFPVVVVLLNPALTTGSYPSASTVRQAMNDIAGRDKNVYILNPAEKPLGSDNIHYDASGYAFLADRFLSLARKIGVRKYIDNGNIDITSQPVVTDQTTTTITVTATAAEYATIYVGVYASGSSNPGYAAIVAGTGTGYVSSSINNILYDESTTTVINGLTASTNYEVFAFLEDLAGNRGAIQTLAATTASPGGPAVIFSDTFTEATNTELSQHTPDTGTGWVKWNGSSILQVLGGGGYVTQAVSGDLSYASLNTLSGAVNRVEAKLYLFNGFTHPGLLFAGVDSTSYWAASFRSGTTPRIEVYQYASSIYNLIYTANGAAQTANAYSTCAVEWDSVGFKIFVNGVAYLTQSQTLTGAGSYAGLYTKHNAIRVDDFATLQLLTFTT